MLIIFFRTAPVPRYLTQMADALAYIHKNGVQPRARDPGSCNCVQLQILLQLFELQIIASITTYFHFAPQRGNVMARGGIYGSTNPARVGG